MVQKMILSPYSTDEFKAIFREIVREELQGLGALGNAQNDEKFEMLTRQEAMAFLKVGATKFNGIRKLLNPIIEGVTKYYLKEELIAYRRSLIQKKGDLQ